MSEQLVKNAKPAKTPLPAKQLIFGFTLLLIALYVFVVAVAWFFYHEFIPSIISVFMILWAAIISPIILVNAAIHKSNSSLKPQNDHDNG